MNGSHGQTDLRTGMFTLRRANSLQRLARFRVELCTALETVLWAHYNPIKGKSTSAKIRNETDSNHKSPREPEDELRNIGKFN